MPDYLQDLDLEDGDVHLGDGNDIALTSGRANLEQTVEIIAGDAIEQFVGSNVNGTAVSLLEERLRQALNATPKVSQVYSVSVVQFDKRTNTISLEITLGENENFIIEVSP